MEIHRVHKTENYTVMSNYHLKEKDMSLKAKGLLSIILSLPNNWDFSIKGLASLCKDGQDSVKSAIKELEKFGYIIVTRFRNEKGRFDTLYDIYETPQKDASCDAIEETEMEENAESKTPQSFDHVGETAPDKPRRINHVGKTAPDKPCRTNRTGSTAPVNPPQLNTNNKILKSNTYVSNTYVSNTKESGAATAAHPSRAKKPVRHKYGNYKNVLLSDDQMQKLKAEFPNDYQERIENMSEYCEIHGRGYKNYYAAIKAWARKDKDRRKDYGQSKPKDQPQGKPVIDYSALPF